MRLDLGEEAKSRAMSGKVSQKKRIKRLSSHGLQTMLIYQSLSGISKLHRQTQWPLNFVCP